MPVSEDEKKRSVKRLKRFTAQADSIKNDDAVYERFKKYKKNGGKDSMANWLRFVDTDAMDMELSKKNERMRQNSFRAGKTAMDYAKTKDDSVSVRRQRDAGLSEKEIALNVKESAAFREAMKKRIADKKKKKK